MGFYSLRFNLYLCLALAAAGLAGCQTGSSKDKDKAVAALRIFIENRAQLPDTGKTVSVLRDHPVEVKIGAEPFLTEASLLKAQKLETPGGGYALQLQFNQDGTWLLEQYTGSNPGRHLVLFAQWSDPAQDKGLDKKQAKEKEAQNKRWLAAPLISRRIANGELSFTPDVSPEELDVIIRGLNNAAKAAAKKKG